MPGAIITPWPTSADRGSQQPAGRRGTLLTVQGKRNRGKKKKRDALLTPGHVLDPGPCQAKAQLKKQPHSSREEAGNRDLSSGVEVRKAERISRRLQWVVFVKTAPATPVWQNGSCLVHSNL